MKDRIYDLPNTFFSLRFVGYGWLNLEKCRRNNITVANSPGCNKHAMAEWMIGFMINLLRRQNTMINTVNSRERIVSRTIGLKDKKVAILGKGNIGTKIGVICEAFEMQVSYFTREDILLEVIKEADVIFNCLSLNETTKNLLDNNFFRNCKRGSYFISATADEVFNIEAMIKALDDNILTGAGIDAGSIQVGDADNPYYKKLIKHPKILATPHVAYDTDVTDCVCNDMAIDNVEAWVKGKPLNIVI
jgi:phosphoglycerate dehydrogenase-like enzyme